MLLNRQPISIEELGPLLIQPVAAASVAITTSTNVSTIGHTFRVPIVTADPSAAFVAEGDEIPLSDAVLGEIVVTPAKVAGLSVVSRELANDSSPAAQQVIGDGLARDIAKRVDLAWFGALPTPAPSGLAALAGVQTVSAGTAFKNLDSFAQAISLGEQVGARITSFVTDPATALVLSQIKAATGSNVALLGADPAAAGARTVLGVPLISSPAVAAGTVWAYDRARVWTVIRQEATLDVDPSVFFTSDRVAIRATMRVGFAFGHPASVIKITTS